MTDPEGEYAFIGVVYMESDRLIACVIQEKISLKETNAIDRVEKLLNENRN
jgi:hypothetical protein